MIQQKLNAKCSNQSSNDDETIIFQHKIQAYVDKKPKFYNIIRTFFVG